MFKLDNKHTLLEMAQVGKFADYTCSVYGKEGSVPHFHFYTKDKKISGCIRLDAPDYFVHGKHKSKLSSKERKQLMEWLNSFHEGYKKLGVELTIYSYICILWNDNNQEYLFEAPENMPDYTQLPVKD